MYRLDRLTPDDLPHVKAIYAEGIATGDATLESEPPWCETCRGCPVRVSAGT